MSIKRQFIAGASCPMCGQLDKVQRVEDGRRLWMECVRCGMTRPLDGESSSASRETQAQPVTVRPLPPDDTGLH